MFIYLLINRINTKYFIVYDIFASIILHQWERPANLIRWLFLFTLKIYEYWHP
jgi:hypothetical protein